MNFNNFKLFITPSAAIVTLAFCQPGGAAAQSDIGRTLAVHSVSAAPPTQSYDFGTLEATHINVISTPFVFRNTTARALAITQLHSSCGCTAAVLGAKSKLPVTLAPGASLPVTVDIDSYHLTPGSIDKSVTIYAAGHADPVAVLRVTGTILPPVIFSPATLDFGHSISGQTQSVSLSLAYDDTMNANDGDVTLVSHDPNITIDPVGSASPASNTPIPGVGREARHVRVYTIHLNPGHTIGNLTGRLVAVLQAKTSATRDIELGDISYFANVQGDVQAVPSVISFGQIASGKSATQTFLIEGKALNNLTVTSPVSYLSIQLGPVRHGSGLARPFGAPAPKPAQDETNSGDGTVEATVVLSPSAPAGPLQSSVTVKTTDGQQLTLPVYAIVAPR